MKYIISDTQLKNLICKMNYDNHKPAYNLVDDFLKDKKPVEMIANGKVSNEIGYGSSGNLENKIGFNDNGFITGYVDSLMNEIITKYFGKNIEIYIKQND